MIRLRYDPSTSKEVSDLVEFLQRLHRPGKRQVRAVADAVRRGFADNFTRQQSGSGQPWARLAESTIEQRIRQGYGSGPILRRSGDFRASFINAGSPDHYEQYEQKASGWTLRVGSNHWLDEWLQGGTRRGFTFHMAGRPVTVLSRRAGNQGLDTLDLLFRQLEP